MGGLLGWLFVRTAGSSPTTVLLTFEIDAIPLADADDDHELLLDDPVSAPIAQSRVVSLFGAAVTLPTAGELQRRIDRHLDLAATPQWSGPHLLPDASDALFEALADLRRSLRRG